MAQFIMDEFLNDITSDKNFGVQENTLSLESEGVKRLMAELLSLPLLTPEEEKSLFRQIIKTDNNDEKKRLRNIIAERNSRLVYYIAKQERKTDGSCSMTLMDAFQEGQIGLMNAINNYDITKGTKLSTFATPWIRQSIRKAAANYGSDFGAVPSHVYCDSRKLLAIYNKISEKENRSPTIAELAEETEFSARKVQDLLLLVQRHSSIDATVDVHHKGADKQQKSEMLGDLISSENATSMEESLEVKEELAYMIETARKILNDTSMQIFLARRCNDSPESYKNLSRRLHIPIDKIREIDRETEILLTYIKEKGHLPQII